MVTPIVTEIRRHGAIAPPAAPAPPKPGIQVPRPRAADPEHFSATGH